MKLRKHRQIARWHIAGLVAVLLSAGSVAIASNGGPLPTIQHGGRTGTERALPPLGGLPAWSEWVAGILPRVVTDNQKLLCQSVDVALIGVTLQMKSFWPNHGVGRSMRSKLSIRVERLLHGIAGEEIVVEIAGGQEGAFWYGVGGIPQIYARERYLLFLREGRQGEYGVVGGGTGAILIDKSIGLPPDSLLRTLYDQQCDPAWETPDGRSLPWRPPID